MAFYTDGVVPWDSLDNNTRAPLASELEGGYPCGEADQELFNWTAGWPIGNIWNMLLQSGITPDPDKLLDLARAVQSGKVNYAIAAGTANALTVTLSPAPSSLTVGMIINVKATASSTGASTLNVNGLGAAQIVTSWGADTGAGDILAGTFNKFTWDGTKWWMNLATAQVQSGGINFAQTAGSVNALTATLSPAPAALRNGLALRLYISTVNTGAVTLNVNGLGAVPVVAANGTAMAAGQLTGLVDMTYYGGNWVVSGAIRVQTVQQKAYASSGTYTPATNVLAALVRGVGGGGGGGGSAGGGSTAAAAGGGGAGGYCEGWYIRSLIASGVAFTVGGGGGGGGAGNNFGSAGGSTTFGSFFTASGGGGGSGSATTGGTIQFVGGAIGGGAIGGTLNVQGSPGCAGISIFSGGALGMGGAGANSVFGGGATSKIGPNNGDAAVGYGSGGGGAVAGNSSQSGGAGAAGIILITEFLG